jgi:hypothetical protein
VHEALSYLETMDVVRRGRVFRRLFERLIEEYTEVGPNVLHTSAYVSIRQHTSAYVSMRRLLGRLIEEYKYTEIGPNVLGFS